MTIDNLNFLQKRADKGRHKTAMRVDATEAQISIIRSDTPIGKKMYPSGIEQIRITLTGKIRGAFYDNEGQQKDGSIRVLLKLPTE